MGDFIDATHTGSHVEHVAAYGDEHDQECAYCEPEGSTFAALSDAELERMCERAWREAVRCWADVRACQDPALAILLRESAKSADAFHTSVNAARHARGLG